MEEVNAAVVPEAAVEPEVAQAAEVARESNNNHNHNNHNNNEDEEVVLAAVVVEDDDEDDEEEVLSVAEEVVAVVEQAPRPPPPPQAPPKVVKKRKKKKKAVRPERIQAAHDAREVLSDEVTTLPLAIGECQVRSFGRLRVDDDDDDHDHANKKKKNSPFCTTSALYPVGFSCDRYEFSPVHGRVVKLRCSILNVEDKPLFRVVWGQGIDEDENVEYPFSLAHEAPPPAVGMRVRVKFTAKQAYGGSITSAVQKTSKTYKIAVRYDDGSVEKLEYPDADVTLVVPGTEEEEQIPGEITEWKGKPVQSAVGRSPLEAWGQVLVKLGLIDEIMLEGAMQAVEKAREEALEEAKLKLEGKSQAAKSPAKRPDEPGAAGEPAADAQAQEDDKEPPSEREKAMRERVEMLQAELEEAEEADRQACIALADARVQRLGLCNPFCEAGLRNQQSWLATAVRKEKTRMGSTGNRKKIVSAVDMLERNNCIYDCDIEGLIEGLPGSEYCKPYVFQAFRGLNRAWVHEAQVEQERVALQKRSREVMEREQHKVDMERERKRRKKLDLRDAKKRQKLEEEEEKRRARMDERLSRLRVQVDERLFKEATAQREKVVTSLARSLGREFTRRRKAAELIAGQAIVESTDRRTQEGIRGSGVELPAISKVYDEDTIRVWDFVSTFSDFFLERGFMTEIPSLDTLQDAIDCVRGKKMNASLSKVDAINSLTDLAVALCKPLAASLTRVLFASLIALNPVLQKDFGAAFFNEVNANPSAKSDSDVSRADVLLPVNSMTWQEIARLTFLADALGELGYSRHETAHILRGYRSAGHPNSKEARRLRRAEEFTVALLRQSINESRLPSRPSNNPNVVRADVPCKPLCDPTDYRFFLHNIQSMKDASPPDLTRNLVEALSRMRGHANLETQYQELERLKSLLADLHSSNQSPSKTEAKVLKMVRDGVIRVLQDVAGIASDEYATKASQGLEDEDHDWKRVDFDDEICREQMGLLRGLEMTSSDYKKLAHSRENYMEDALTLKEELERQKGKGEDEDDDEDDDDDDNGSRAEVVENGDDAKKENGEDARPDNLQSTHIEKDEDMKDAMPEEGQKVDIENSKEKKDDKAENGQSTGTKKSEETTALTDQEATVEPSDTAPSVETDSKVSNEGSKIGKTTPYDEFCADMPNAPETIRRCLAILRTLCVANCAEPFLYPVDPQTNPAYYDSLINPMCLREVGKQLRLATNSIEKETDVNEDFVDEVVAQFARNVRLVGQNCLSYANAGPTVIAAGSELLRIFERLLLDWVLAPEDMLPPLTELDDDRCVVHHTSDAESTVLLCDGCEGKYNIARLDPPLREIPKGDWYCPRCVGGRWWGSLDPRIGKKVHKVVAVGKDIETTGPEGRVKKCLIHSPEGPSNKASLMYVVSFEDGREEMWPLAKLDKALSLSGNPVPPVRCLEAVAESVGYGFGVDHGLRQDLVPVPANPNVSDGACQVALSSSVFRDTIAASGTLLVINPRDMTASEWLRLLVLLAMKCAASDVLQNVISKMEIESAEKMAAPLERIGKISKIKDVLPSIDEYICSDDDAEVVDDTMSNGGDVTSQSLTNTSSKDSEAVSSGEVVVEAKSVEVVDEMDIETAPVKSIDAVAVSDNAIVSPAQEVAQVVVPPPVVKLKPFEAALIAKRRRQKVTEDSFAAYAIKNQVRSSVASFEEDTFSPVVDACLSSKNSPLDFSNLRCRRMQCTFCGLTDIALGCPIVRVPNEEEWDRLIPHAARSRRTHLVAQMPTDTQEGTLEGSPASKLVSMKIILKDEVFSVPCERDDTILDGGMTEFLPRSESGFQDELRFRDDTNLPFVTGSLSAHECCAVAAHKSRKQQMVERYKERQAELIEKTFGMECGRTLELSRDCAGRSYWKFASDPESLFICSESESGISWERYPDAASVASVIVCLGRDPTVKNLRHAYPAAEKLVSTGTWSDALLKKRFPKVAEMISEDLMDTDDHAEEVSTLEVVGGLDAYHVGESVLVESKSGRLLWDAVVTAQSKKQKPNNEGLIIDGYRVAYTDWSSRFTEWVEPIRVVEPNKNNRLLQDERLDELAQTRFGLPAELNFLVAADYLDARERARAKDALPDFARVAHVDSHKSSDAKTLGLMKAALFAIEAALPVGCIDNRESGPWRRRFSEKWKRTVEHADGPALLVRCTVLLEETISPAWIKEEVGHLRSCLPAKWKATGEASPSALALRVILLDRSIMYETIDRKRFSARKRRR